MGLKEFWERQSYVLAVSRKPTNEEIQENFKVVMIGIIIVGVIGFAVSMIFRVIGGLK